MSASFSSSAASSRVARPWPVPVIAGVGLRPAIGFARGHLATYIGLFLFTTVVYLRPYEMFPQLSFLSTSAFWLALATVAVFIPAQLATGASLLGRVSEVHLLLAFCFTGLLSMPLAINPGEAWDTFNDSFIKCVLVFVIMVNVVRTQRRLVAIMVLILAISCVLAGGALGDYWAGNLTVEGYRVEGMIGGMFGNPNDLALHLVTMIPIAAALMFMTRSMFMKVLHIAAAILMVGGIMVTFSRGGFLGLMLSGLILAWKLGRQNRAGAVVLTFLAVMVFFVAAPGNYGSRVSSIVNHSLDPFGSATMRRELLDLSIQVALRNPVVGIGMGNFHSVSIKEQATHNSYTQVGAEMGLVAVAIYVLFIVTPLKGLRRIERDTFDTRRTLPFYYLSVGLQASLIGYLVSSFFASVAYLWYVYYLGAYAVCLRRMHDAWAEQAQLAPAGATTPSTSGPSSSSGSPVSVSTGWVPRGDRAGRGRTLNAER